MNRLDGDKDTITPLQSAANISRLFLDSGYPAVGGFKRPCCRAGCIDLTHRSWPDQGRRPCRPGGWSTRPAPAAMARPTISASSIRPAGDPVVIAAYFHATGDSTDAQREAVIADATRIALSALGNA
jgi:beta-lactamase class A